MLRILTVLILYYLSLIANDKELILTDNIEYSGTISVSNRHRTISSTPFGVNEEFDQKEYILDQTLAINFTDKLRLISSYELSRRDNSYSLDGFQYETFSYFKALYLTYNICGNSTIFAGLVPYTGDYLNIYAKKQEQIGEGLMIINGSLLNTIGYVYNNDDFKFKVGYHNSSFLDMDKGHYDEINMGDESANYGMWSILSYKYNNHKYEFDTLTVKNKEHDINLMNGALGYIYDDFDDNGYAIYSQLAISSFEEGNTAKDGYAYSLAVKIDSDLMDYAYKFEYGIEYIHTSKYYTNYSTKVTNNRYNNLFRGNRTTLFSSVWFTKNFGASSAFININDKYIRGNVAGYQKVNDVVKVDLHLVSLYLSLFYHF